MTASQFLSTFDMQFWKLLLNFQVISYFFSNCYAMQLYRKDFSQDRLESIFTITHVMETKSGNGQLQCLNEKE